MTLPALSRAVLIIFREEAVVDGFKVQLIVRKSVSCWFIEEYSNLAKWNRLEMVNWKLETDATEWLTLFTAFQSFFGFE